MKGFCSRIAAVPSATKVFCTRIAAVPSAMLIGLVRGYQLLLSPLLGHQCRFEPTCSRYFIQAVRKYGAVSGTLRGMWRICRCNPFCRGGWDPP